MLILIHLSMNKRKEILSGNFCGKTHGSVTSNEALRSSSLNKLTICPHADRVKKKEIVKPIVCIGSERFVGALCHIISMCVLCTREYWRNHRGPGFLAGSYPLPPLTLSPVSRLSLFLSLPVCRRSSLLTGGGGAWGRRQRESLVLYISFNTLCCAGIMGGSRGGVC
jgi:hypothetical protein